MLGLYDRRKAKEQTRFHMIMICISLLYTRRQIRVNKILVHENFTGATNDIALLRLGLNIEFRCDPLRNLYNNQLTEEIVDLSVFRPLCLPDFGESFVGQSGSVYGEQHHENNLFNILSISGWGNTGSGDFSTDKLQETALPIVSNNNCFERMNQTEDVDEDHLLCAGREGVGPCKVNLKRKSHFNNNIFYPGRQWGTTFNRE